MKAQIMISFAPLPGEGNNPAGVAIYTYSGRSIELPMPSYSRARDVEDWIGHVVGNARRIQRQAMTAQLRGAINVMEGDTEPSRLRTHLEPEQ